MGLWEELKRRADEAAKKRKKREQEAREKLKDLYKGVDTRLGGYLPGGVKPIKPKIGDTYSKVDEALGGILPKGTPTRNQALEKANEDYKIKQEKLDENLKKSISESKRIEDAERAQRIYDIESKRAYDEYVKQYSEGEKIISPIRKVEDKTKKVIKDVLPDSFEKKVEKHVSEAKKGNVWTKDGYVKADPKDQRSVKLGAEIAAELWKAPVSSVTTALLMYTGYGRALTFGSRFFKASKVAGALNKAGGVTYAVITAKDAKERGLDKAIAKAGADIITFTAVGKFGPVKNMINAAHAKALFNTRKLELMKTDPKAAKDLDLLLKKIDKMTFTNSPKNLDIKGLQNLGGATNKNGWERALNQILSSNKFDIYVGGSASARAHYQRTGGVRANDIDAYSKNWDSPKLRAEVNRILQNNGLKQGVDYSTSIDKGHLYVTNLKGKQGNRKVLEIGSDKKFWENIYSVNDQLKPRMFLTRKTPNGVRVMDIKSQAMRQAIGNIDFGRGKDAQKLLDIVRLTNNDINKFTIKGTGDNARLVGPNGKSINLKRLSKLNKKVKSMPKRELKKSGKESVKKPVKETKDYYYTKAGKGKAYPYPKTERYRDNKYKRTPKSRVSPYPSRYKTDPSKYPTRRFMPSDVYPYLSNEDTKIRKKPKGRDKLRPLGFKPKGKELISEKAKARKVTSGMFVQDPFKRWGGKAKYSYKKNFDLIRKLKGFYG